MTIVENSLHPLVDVVCHQRVHGPSEHEVTVDLLLLLFNNV